MSSITKVSNKVDLLKPRNFIVLLVIYAVWIGLVWIGGGYFVMEPFVIDRFRPPENAHLSNFESVEPKPYGIVNITNGHESFYVIFGRGPIPYFTDDRSGYLFDETGELIAWTPEAGLFDKNWRYWSLAIDKIHDGETLTYDEIELKKK